MSEEQMQWLIGLLSEWGSTGVVLLVFWFLRQDVTRLIETLLDLIYAIALDDVEEAERAYRRGKNGGEGPAP
jgi:hypothetical protein